MTLLEKLEMIERIDGLIRRKATGTPKQLASRLGISERGLFKTLKLMKEMGAPIYYCLSRESYAYQYNVEFSIGFSAPERSKTKIAGGLSSLFITAQNVQSNDLNCIQMRI